MQFKFTTEKIFQNSYDSNVCTEVYLFSKVNKCVNYKKKVSNSLSSIIMVPFLIYFTYKNFE